jgi:general secretion pathway protein D
MKFAEIFRLSALLMGMSVAISAQEELIDESNPPDVNGMFDEELEIIDEGEDVDQPNGQIISPNGDRNFEETPRPLPLDRPSVPSFPSPRSLPSSPSSSSSQRGLPSFPQNVSVPNENEKLRMDFVQVDIEEIVKFFAERLQKRFIYDPTTLSGKITIISPTEVTLREAWGAFLSALEVRGYIVFPAGPFLKIEKAANARKAPVPVVTGETPNDDSFVTRIVTLRYLNVNDIRQAVRNLLSRTAGDVLEHPPTNTLIISDYAFNIRRIIRILNLLDVEGFQEQITVITLKHASAADVARQVSEFFPQQSATQARTPIRRPSQAAAAATGGNASVVQKVVADERTNSLIILGSERGIEQVRKFIDQIDVPIEGGGGQIHVYPLQNVKAEDISQTLAALTSGQSRTSLRGANPLPGQIAQPAQGSNSPTSASLLGGEVKITADTPTNSLVIQASPRDFETLRGIIQKLDIRRRQVFIESAILEASVKRGASVGTQASGPFAKTGVLGRDASSTESKIDSAGVFSVGNLAQSLDSLLQNPSQLTGLALGFRSGGTYTISTTDSSGNTVEQKIPLLSAIIRLAASNEDLNVLSTPHVLATANEEATISIGEEIPQITNSTTTEGGATTRSFSRVRVATELNITPQINAGDYITLKIKQKVNSVGTRSIDGQLNTINREATTTAIVRDQQTIVIGGLMEDRKQVTESKVPFLGDIPILGWLFKSRSTDNQKVNLLLFLTPHIIKDTANMNDQFFNKLRERERFMKDLGMKENKNLPIQGLSSEQKRMLDPDYVKSLREEILLPLPPAPEEPVVIEDKQENPGADKNTLKMVEPDPAPKAAPESSPESIPEEIPPMPLPMPSPIKSSTPLEGTRT